MLLGEFCISDITITEKITNGGSDNPIDRTRDIRP